MTTRSVCVLVAATIHTVAAASEFEGHDHRGRLARYEVGPPSFEIGADGEERLRQGKSLMQALTSEGSDVRRLVMVQDIKAPGSVVMGRILDFERYDKMVDGVDLCSNYGSSTAAGVETTKSEYNIHALHLKMRYFMEHHYDAAQNCMVFNLDYDRKSDLDDSVGYWYVEPRGRAACRVYYSAEVKLRGWVPAPVYNVLTKKALAQATTWVSREALEEWRQQQRTGLANNPMVRFVAHARDEFETNMRQLRARPLQPPTFVSKLMQSRSPVVRFVGARRVKTPAAPSI